MTVAIALELCLATDDSRRLQHNVQQAVQFGVSRLELCSAMHQDGLSPTCAEVALARRYWGEHPGVMAMLRPRGGDFCYSPSEIAGMLALLPALAEAGADAVVTGVLQQDPAGQLQLHRQALTELAAAAAQLGLTFCLHRAFDALSDPLRSWQQLVAPSQLTPSRVLSSGCRWQNPAPVGATDNAVAGVGRLMQQLALGGPELVVAGGVNATNLPWLRQQLMAALPQAQTTPEAVRAQPFSFHLYSAVLRDGWVDPVLLQAVLAQCNSPAA